MHKRLNELGWLKVWLDKEDLLGGQHWELEIPKAVKNSHIVIICLSTNVSTKIAKGSYINREFKLAWEVAETQPKGAISIVPLRLEDCVVPAEFEPVQWADYFQPDGWDKLVRSLKQRAIELGVLNSGSSEALSTVKPPKIVINNKFGLARLRSQVLKAELKQAWAEVVELGEAILGQQPENSEIEEKIANAYFKLAQNYRQSGDYAEAVENISMAIEFDQKRAEYFGERAFLYLEIGNTNAALKDFQQALRVEPTEAQFYFEIGKIQHQNKKLAEALQAYNNAIEHNNANGEYYYYRGLIFTYQNKLAEAVRDFEIGDFFGHEAAQTELKRIEVAQQAEQEEKLKQAAAQAELKRLEEEKRKQAEKEGLIRELESLSTTHQRRREIGIRLAEIGDTRPGVGVRADGIPDIAWLPVTPGGNITITIDKTPQTFAVAPFYIAKYPVTFAQYEAFVTAPDGFNNPKWWEGMPDEYQRQQLNEQYHKGANQPRYRVSCYQATAFSRWLNARLQGWTFPALGNPKSGERLTIGQQLEVRLPAEWEWQWAAQGGSEQWEYPWGDWKDGYANTSEAGLQETLAVGMYPHGAAKCGAMDMSGQVCEWNTNKYSKNGSYRVLRGGSYSDNSFNAACAFRYNLYPSRASNFRGFRVVVVAPVSASDL